MLLALQNRADVLSQYQLLKTDQQRKYFRKLISSVALQKQAPLANVLTRLTPRMTEDLAADGPLHEPDISSFRSELSRMSAAEKEILGQLPIGERALNLYFPDERDRPSKAL